MSFLPFDENPEVERAAFYALEKKIFTTFHESEKEIYDNALEIYKKETGDNNLYIAKITHFMDKELGDYLYALQYKERRDASKFYSILDTLRYKNYVSQHFKDDEIEIYMKPTNGGILPQDHENIIGKLVDKDEVYATIKLRENGKLRTIKYEDIAIIID